ncbi:hypothetical protein M747DRAFT_92567 [Aspergillus niger ATCC 13496]|uniref:Uncharacterized protein n=1 Tax=Aspergillus niger ATCC 13496 TaxID=1353008 RepID=A0A370CAI1_ASPNG|nr:hypothetical protein M747DRAFT_92567 [Aspergillus niger ATCC 13496]
MGRSQEGIRIREGLWQKKVDVDGRRHNRKSGDVAQSDGVTNEGPHAAEGERERNPSMGKTGESDGKKKKRERVSELVRREAEKEEEKEKEEK